MADAGCLPCISWLLVARLVTKRMATSLQPLCLVFERVDHQKRGFFLATFLVAALASSCVTCDFRPFANIDFCVFSSLSCLIAKQPLSRPIWLRFPCWTTEGRFGRPGQCSNKLLEGPVSWYFCVISYSEVSFLEGLLVFRLDLTHQVRGFMVDAAISWCVPF